GGQREGRDRGTHGAGLVARVGHRDAAAAAAATADDGVRDLAAVAVVAPGALHRERAGGEAHVLRAAGAAGQPRALVGVLLTGGVGPAAGRVLVGDGLGVLVALDHGDAVEGAGRAGVDEVLAAGGARVGDVRHVRERD